MAITMILNKYMIKLGTIVFSAAALSRKDERATDLCLSIPTDPYAITYTEDTVQPLCMTLLGVEAPAVTVNLTLSDPFSGNLAAIGQSTNSLIAVTQGIWQADGSQEAVNLLLKGLRFIPTENFFGNTTIFVTANYSNIGAPLTSLIHLSGISVNDNPVLKNDENAIRVLNYPQEDKRAIMPMLTISDADNSNITRAAVITTLDASSIMTYTPTPGIDYRFENNMLILSGNASIAVFQNALRNIFCIVKPNESFDGAYPTYSFVVGVVDDHESASNSVEQSVLINYAPVVTLNCNAQNIHQTHIPVVIYPNITIINPDDAITVAQMRIKNYIYGDGVLNITEQPTNINVFFDDVIGVFRLSTPSVVLPPNHYPTISDYQSALRKVTYTANNSHTKVIDVVVNDVYTQSGSVDDSLYCAISVTTVTPSTAITSTVAPSFEISLNDTSHASIGNKNSSSSSVIQPPSPATEENIAAIAGGTGAGAFALLTSVVGLFACRKHIKNQLSKSPFLSC